MKVWSPAKWLAAGCLMVALGLAVWIAVLPGMLESSVTVRRWDVSWVGLDVAEEIALLLTAMCLWRGSRRRLPFYATIAGTLFAVDAWFDTLTTQTGTAYAASLTQALMLETPLAIGCLVLAWKGASAESSPRVGSAEQGLPSGPPTQLSPPS